MMNAGQNFEGCTLSDIDFLNMDFTFVNEGMGCFGGIDTSTSFDDTVFMSFDPNLGLFDEKQSSFHVIQQGYNAIQCQPNYQAKELTDCLYSNVLEPSEQWSHIPLPPVQFDTYTQEPHRTPEFMDISEMKKELPDDIAFSNTCEKPMRRKPGRKKGQPVSNVYHLWEFIRDLLKDPDHKNLITWEDRDKGIFRMIKSGEVAKLWGEKKKNKRLMNYEKMSRSLRYSRKEGYFMEIPRDGSYPKKLCFRFGPKSYGWK